ncbi:MAG: DUF302 domain-containing protein [Prolixibacteraceae bacterium]
MSYYFSKNVIGKSFEEVESLVIEKLKEQGFGVITQIDMKNTFKTKLDVDFRPYKILGACNPKYAFNALSVDDKVGVMLPCNVCIQQKGENDIEVFAVNPLVAMEAVQNPKVELLAKEITEKLNRVIESI